MIHANFRKLDAHAEVDLSAIYDNSESIADIDTIKIGFKTKN